jgi:hypothetical protein
MGPIAMITNGADAFLAFTGLIVAIFVLMLITISR